jgi:ribonuclease J
MGDPKKYFMITTGHQGEPQAVLNRMADGAFKFTSDDTVIFSCTVIPTEINKKNRDELEEKLDAKRVNMIRDIHVSGHAFAKDHIDLLNWTKPQFLLPLHGEPFMTKAMEELAKDKAGTILRLRINEKFSISDSSIID